MGRAPTVDRPLPKGERRVSDAALVRDARAGSTEAFAELYDRHAGRVYDFLCSVMGDEAAAADVLQATFMVAGARLRRLRDPAKVRPWLFAIARHQAFRRMGRRSRRKRPPAVTLKPGAPDLTDEATAAERAELVRVTAAALSRRHRVVLDLHRRQGLEGRELAQALGVSWRRAGVAVSRLRDEAERALRILWVARTGRRHCPGLAGILAGWDGRMTRRLRKRVARHADGCRTCLDRRRKVASSLALLSTVPPRLPPAPLRARVLGGVKLARRRRRPWPAARGGFPPPLVLPHRRPVELAAAATALAVVAAVVVLANRGNDDAPQVAATDSPPAADSDVFEIPELGDEPVFGPDGGELPAGAGADLSELDELDRLDDLDGSAAPGAQRRPGSGSRGGGDPSGGGSADGGGSSLGSVAVDPTTVLEDDGSGACGRAARSLITRVTVTPPDPSAVASAAVSWGGPRPGSEDLVASEGGAYEAVIGPFDLGAVPAGQSIDVSLTVRAVDTAGKESVQTASFTLRSCD